MMVRKAYSENGMVTDGWVSADPTDTELIEGVYRRTIRDAEERLMFAVLENAVEYFQKYVPGTETERKAAISRSRGVVSRERR